MPKFLDLVWGKKVEGKDKPIYKKCGVVMIKDDGKISVNIELMPVGDGFNGWLNAYEQKDRADDGHKEATTDLEPF